MRKEDTIIMQNLSVLLSYRDISLLQLNQPLVFEEILISYLIFKITKTSPTFRQYLNKYTGSEDVKKEIQIVINTPEESEVFKELLTPIEKNTTESPYLVDTTTGRILEGKYKRQDKVYRKPTKRELHFYRFKEVKNVLHIPLFDTVLYLTEN